MIPYRYPFAEEFKHSLPDRNGSVGRYEYIGNDACTCSRFIDVYELCMEEVRMRISIGNDHCGFPLKQTVLDLLEALGHEVIDHGCHSEDPVDFPDIVEGVCRSIQEQEADRGLLLCGSGIGACMAANKMQGIRAALNHDIHCAHQSVEHDDANVMCIGAKIVGPWLAADLIQAFLEAEFFNHDPDRVRRVDKLNRMDANLGSVCVR